MKFTSKILNMALLALMLAVTACSQDEPLPAPDRPGADSVTTFLRMSLQLPVESAPRSNPSGGEEGDGRLPGINNENTIHDISIFIYSHDLGLDCPAETPVAVKLHFTEPELRAYKVKDTQNTYLLPLGDIYPVGCRIAVAANIGFLSRDITTMGQLRTHICQRSFMAGDLVDGTPQAISGADRFVMSNAYNGAKSGNLDGFIVIPQGDRPGSQQNPLTAEVWLERMAARIDLLLKDENIRGPFPVADGFLRYDVTENGKRTATVVPSHIIPVNVMQHPSYLFKHVTAGDDINGSLLVCGDETTDTGNDVPTNYVIEPRTLSKSTVSVTTAAEWYGSTAIQHFLNADAYTDRNRLDHSWYRITDGTNTEAGFNQYAILSYANENTQHKDILGSDVLTGLVIKAVYCPAEVYSAYASGTLSLIVSPTFPMNLWQYRPNGSDVTDADCLYFSNREAAVAYQNAQKGMGIITEYPGGVCYYNMWIRHANDNSNNPGPDRHVPMEYGIVRNNVYRISFTFHGIGDPTPDTPRSTENLQSRIYVRDWAFKRHPEIIM